MAQMRASVFAPDGYDPNDPAERALRTQYSHGDRSDEARRAISHYNAWYREDRKRRDAEHRARADARREEHPAPAPAVIPRVKPEEAPAAPPAETRPQRPVPAPPAGDQQTAARGASRRLRALAWMGYPDAVLVCELGIDHAAVSRLLWYPPATIPTRLHAAIAATYRKLITQPRDVSQAPVYQQRQIARVARWAGPYQWEDIDTDPTPPYKAISTERVDDQEPAPVEVPADTARLLDELTDAQTTARRLKTLSDKQEADLARILGDQRRADAELVDRTAEAGALATSNQIFREQIIESEDRATAAAKDAHAHALKVRDLEEQLLMEQEAYRHLQAEYTRLKAAFAEFEERTRRVPVAVPAPENSPLHGHVVVEQTAEGGTRITLTSPRPAHVTFDGLEVSVDALQKRAS